MTDLSDNDLWDILACPPDAKRKPSERWIYQAKAALSKTFKGGDRDAYLKFFCTALFVATDYYENHARPDDAFQLGGLLVARIEAIFESAVVASGHTTNINYRDTNSYARQAERAKLVVIKTIRGQWELDGDYCVLTFAGKQTGIVDIPEPSTMTVNATNAAIAYGGNAGQAQSQQQSSASISSAQATGGEGGKAVIERGAVSVQANPTVNVASHDPAHTVEKTGEVYEKALAKGIEIGQKMAAPNNLPPPAEGNRATVLNSATMITITELVTEAGRIRGNKDPSDSWVRNALDSAKVKPCFEPPQVNKPKAYPRADALAAIRIKAENE